MYFFFLISQYNNSYFGGCQEIMCKKRLIQPHVNCASHEINFYLIKTHLYEIEIKFKIIIIPKEKSLYIFGCIV